MPGYFTDIPEYQWICRGIECVQNGTRLVEMGGIDLCCTKLQMIKVFKENQRILNKH